MRITFFKGKFKLAILAMLSAVVLGCAALLCVNIYANKNENAAKPGDISAPIANTSSAIAGGETSDNGGIYAPEREAKSTSASDMQSAWETAVATNGTFTLTEDWTAYSDDTNMSNHKSLGSGDYFSCGGLYVTSGHTVTLDLNGNTIDRGLPNAAYHGFAIMVEGTLIIDDSVGGGKIINAGGEMGGICVNGGNLTLLNGTISGNVRYYGDPDGVVNMGGGTFTMSGGEISGNENAGVRVAGNGTFNFNGGKITGNRWGVYGYGAGTVNASPSDGIISDNLNADFYGTQAAWSAAVAYSSAKQTKAALLLSNNMTATTSGSSTSFGTGTGFDDGGLYVPEGVNIVLNLNGYTINKGDKKGASVFKVEGTLEINGDGTITGGFREMYGGGAYVGDGGTLIMNGGKITKNSVEGYGGGVYVDGGTFIMNGGTVSENESSHTRDDNIVVSTGGYFEMNGGLIELQYTPVYIQGGTFTMNGGNISNNKGNVDINYGTFNMTGGEISNNEFTGSSSYGGGVSVGSAGSSGSGVFNMSGGFIKNNSAGYSGGGVNVDGTFNMTGGEISNNVAVYNGGGVYVSGTFNMLGGSIKNNSASEAGGVGAYHDDYTYFHYTDGEISGNLPGDFAGGDDDWNFAVEFSKNTNSYITFALIGNRSLSSSVTGTGFRNGAMLVPSGADIGLNLNGNTIDGSSLSESSVIVEGTLTLTDSTGGGNIKGEQGHAIGGPKLGAAIFINNGTLIMNGGNISGIDASNGSTIGAVSVSGSSAKFEMNGGAIFDNRLVGGGGVLLDSKGTFTMNGGEISGNGATSSEGGGGVIVNSGCTFTMNGGTISDNSASGYSGGGVIVKGTFTMNDGEILNNSAYNGGGVYISTGGTFTMNSGTISGGSARSGTGVYVGGTFTMTGGTITDNTSGDGAVYVEGTFNISGSPKITNNSTYNVYLPSGKKINITGKLVSARIGVALADYTGTITSRYSYYCSSTKAALYFFSDANKTISYSSGDVTITSTTAPTKTTLIWQYSINGGAWREVSGDSVTFEYSSTSYSVRALSSGSSVTLSAFKGSTEFYPNDLIRDAATYYYSVYTNAANYTNPTFEFKITAKTVSIAWSNGTLRYNGQLQYPQPIIDGIINNDAVSIDLDTSSAGTNAGNGYKVTAAGLSGSKASNYKIAAGSNYSTTYSILRAQLTKPSVPGLSEFIYNGAEQTYIMPLVGGLTISDNKATNAGDYTAVLSLDTTNYEWSDGTTASINCPWRILPKQIYISGISVENKEYDGTTAATVDATGIKLIGIVDADKDDHDKLWITFTEGSAFDGSSVGLHTVAITGVALTGTSAANYILEADTVAGYAQIYPKTITISGVVANNKTYDGTTAVTFDVSGATLTGVIASELSDVALSAEGYFNTKNAGEGVAVTVISYKLTGDKAGNYYIDFANSTTSLTADISKAEIEVTLGKTEYVSTYGNALKITYTQTSAVKSESVTLGLEYWNADKSEKLTGVPTNAGTYVVTVVVDDSDPNLANYDIATTGIPEATVTIDKATLTVTVEDLEIEYGSEVPATDDYTLIYSGWLNGDAASVTPSVTVNTDYVKGNNVGDYELTVTAGELANYDIVVSDDNGVLWVVAKSVTVKIDDQTSVYGAAEAELTSNGTAEMNITLEREEGTDVGKYVISGDWLNDNYDITFINGIYEITKATLTVKANDHSIVYGDEVSNNGVEYNGFVNGDDENDLIGGVAYRYTYTQYGSYGNYGIIPYGLSADNYDIIYVNGLLAVGKKTATVTVTNAASDVTSVPANRTEAAQKMKYAVDGTVNGDNLNVVLEIAGTNGEALAWPAVGTYVVTGAAGNTNYSVSFVYADGLKYGTYTVTQGTLIITANTLILGYGDSIAFSSDLDEAVTAEGLPEGATLQSLISDGMISGALTVGESNYTVGGDIYDNSGNRISYTVLPAGLTSTSYNIIYKPGKLMIEPKSITVTLDNKTSVYGAAEVALTASTTGLVDYDPETDGSVVEFLGITGLTRVAGTDAGNYVITAESSTNKNYRVAFVSGVYTIEQCAVTLVWVSGNDNANDFNYTYKGKPQAPVATFEMHGTEYRSDDASGYIEITGSGTNAGDYKAQAFLLNGNLKFESGTDATQSFKVLKRQLKVTWYADKDDIGDASKAIAAPSTLATPVEYAYKSRQPYAPVVVLEGIIDKDNVANFYYISGEQSAVSITPYEAELHILNANYDVASADKKVYFVIVKSAPTGFAWYEDTDFATQISSLKKYTYNGEVQHPVAKALGDEEFVYTIYKITDGTQQRVISAIDVGSYKIEARPLNNNLQLTEAQTTFYFDIEAKEVSVVWSATSFEYNGTEQVPTAYYIDAQGQKVNLTVAGDKGTDADTYSISVTLGNSNYTFVVDGEQVQTVETTYEITAKNIQVTWKSDIADGSWTMVYNGTTVNADSEHQALSATATMFNEVEKVGLKMTVTYRAKASDTPVEVSAIHDAGIYTLCVSLAEESPNYNVIDAEQSFTIEKKQLSVSAENKEVNTGSLAPTLTATYDGFAENESAESLGLDATKWLTTNYNLNSPYIVEGDYTQDSDITKLETITDLTAGGYKGYFIVLTDSEAGLKELNEKLHNYDWSFNYGRMIIIAVEGDVSIILTHVYNGEDLLPAAMYKSGQNWIDLKVEVYTDDTYTKKVEHPEVKDAGDYYVLLRKYSDDGIILEGAEEDGELEGCVKKTFTITQRNVTVNVSDKTVVYGELTEANYADYLNGLWSYASSDALYRPLAGDELKITLSVNLAFDAAGYATVLKDGGNVAGYEICGSWSEDETLRHNYNVVFVGSNGDKGELKVTEAEITFKANETNGFNQIIETDKANGNYLLGLYSRKDGKYEYIDVVGNQNASVKIYYSNVYDRSVYGLTDNLPQNEPDAAWKEMPLCSIPVAADGSFYVNFKIEVANHKAHYGQWTVQVIAGKAYIRIIFSDKQLTLTYGDAALNGTELAKKLYTEGYVTCLDLTDDTFRENVENGNLTAKVVTDEIAVGSYGIVFEGIEKLNPDWIIIYKQDLNANDDTATNIGKYVVTQRKLTISWDQTTFVYDGEAHFPKPSIEGWTRAEGTQTVNGATVYTFTNEELGKTLALTVRTNGGDFTTVGSENFVIAEIADQNYALDALNATRAVSITGSVDPKPDDPDPVVKEGGIPAWAVALLGVVAVLALLVIIVLAVKSKKANSAGDADGFYDDVDENS